MYDQTTKWIWVSMKGVVVVLFIGFGYHLWGRLDADGQSLKNIEISMNDIKNTMANFSRQIAGDERSIANLQSHDGLQ